MQRLRRSPIGAPLVLAMLGCVAGGPGPGEQGPAPSGPPSCTLIGCGPAVTIKLDVPRPFEQLRQTRIAVCRNEQCLQGSFSVLREPSMNTLQIPADPFEIDATHSPHVVIFEQPSGANGTRLQITWWPWDRSDVRDGDMYRVTVADDQGGEVLSLRETVAAYSERYPNGKDCDVVPCRGATIDDTSR